MRRQNDKGTNMVQFYSLSHTDIWWSLCQRGNASWFCNQNMPSQFLWD